jgi:fructokinase
MDAICLGELLIDFVCPVPDVPLIDAPRFEKAPGGAPANVAVGLAKLGLSTGFIGQVGADPFGQFLQRTLAEQGVDTTCLYASPEARTTLAFVATRRDGRKDITFYRHPGADILLRPDQIDLDYLASARLFHFGSVSLSHSPAREATLHAARIAREAGLWVSYDPNWRPTLWEDPQAAQKWIWEAITLAHIVKVAEEEWEFVTGTPDPAAGCRKILDAGPSLVVITRGERGCAFDNGLVAGEVPAFPVEVVDPLGAGDGFVAAMLRQLLKEKDLASLSPRRLQEILLYANAAGALTTQRIGVIPALPTHAEIEGFLARWGK